MSWTRSSIATTQNLEKPILPIFGMNHRSSLFILSITLCGIRLFSLLAQPNSAPARSARKLASSVGRTPDGSGVVPYHSVNFNSKKHKCESQFYSHKLVQQLRGMGRHVIGLRGERHWKTVVPGIDYLHSEQASHLSPANMGAKLFEQVLEKCGAESDGFAERRKCRPAVLTSTLVALSRSSWLEREMASKV